MALTAEHLIVIGRGRLIADTTVEELVRQASGNVVRVRSPQAEELRGHIAGAEIKIVSLEPGLLEVSGFDRGRRSAGPRPRTGSSLHELTPQQVSLEQAFMEMTRDEVEFHTAAALVEAA